MRLTIAVLVSSIGCGGASRPDSIPASSPLSVDEHSAEVERHKREASAHRGQYDPAAGNPETIVYQCTDEPLMGVPYSGGEPLRVMRPCWTSVTNPTAWHLDEVARHRKYASQHRHRIAELLEAEKEACAGLGEAAISHSPLFHREDVLSVTPYHEDNQLRGARVVFRKVPGLTRAWMFKALACHQARAAVMGFSPEFQSYCPASLRGVGVATDDTNEGIVVTFRSPRDEIAAVVLGRAEDLQRRIVLPAAGNELEKE